MATEQALIDMVYRLSQALRKYPNEMDLVTDATCLIGPNKVTEPSGELSLLEWVHVKVNDHSHDERWCWCEDYSKQTIGLVFDGSKEAMVIILYILLAQKRRNVLIVPEHDNGGHVFSQRLIDNGRAVSIGDVLILTNKGFLILTKATFNNLFEVIRPF